MGEARTAIVVFCDDVRQELGNKNTLVGCYTDELVVQRLPAVLPKLAAFIRVRTPATRPFEKLVFRVFYESDAVAELHIPEEELAKLTTADPFIYVNAAMTLSPLALPKAGQITANVETEDGVLEADVILRVKDGAPA